MATPVFEIVETTGEIDIARALALNANGIDLRCTISTAPTELVTGLSINMTRASGIDCSSGVIYGIRIRQQEIGSIGYVGLIDLENYATSTSGADAFLYMRNQGSAVMTSAISIMGTNKPTYFLRLQTAGASGCLVVNSAAQSQKEGALAVRLGASTWYLRLYASAS